MIFVLVKTSKMITKKFVSNNYKYFFIYLKKVILVGEKVSKLSGDFGPQLDVGKTGLMTMRR